MNVRSFLTTGKNGICHTERNVISKFISFVEYVNGLFEEEFVFNTRREKKGIRECPLTMGGCTCSLLMRLRYLDMLRDGSIRSCMSRNSRWYLPGNFSHVCLSRETAPWPSPEMILNIELKFLHSLHCPEKSTNKVN